MMAEPLTRSKTLVECVAGQVPRTCNVVAGDDIDNHRRAFRKLRKRVGMVRLPPCRLLVDKVRTFFQMNRVSDLRHPGFLEYALRTKFRDNSYHELTFAAACRTMTDGFAQSASAGRRRSRREPFGRRL